MKKYLSLDGAGQHFLLSTDNIVELFDANASAEPLSAVLVGDGDTVYWRGVLSALMDVSELLQEETNDTYMCYVVCRGVENPAKYFILKVKGIWDLLDIDEPRLRPIDIENPRLSRITQQVCIMAGEEQLSFVLQELEVLFSAYHHAAIR